MGGRVNLHSIGYNLLPEAGRYFYRKDLLEHDIS